MAVRRLPQARKRAEVPRWIIVDANNVCSIQRHAFGDTLSHDEELTGIMWGVFHQIVKLGKRFGTSRFAFAWDSRKRYRAELYPEYKANREVEPEWWREQESRYRQQFHALRRELLPAFGFSNNFIQTGIEADDLIASALLHNGFETKPLVVSSDWDMWQMLDHCDVYRPVSVKQEIVTRDSFIKRWGITPDQWVPARAISGDKSDNIPGVEGAGEKTAIKYVRDELKPGAKRDAINAARDTIERNERLMRLPFEGTEEVRLAVDGRFREEVFVDICERYKFMSFLKPDALHTWREVFFHSEDG